MGRGRDTLKEARAQTLGKSLTEEANVDTLAATLSEVEGERLGNTRQCVGQGTNGHAS